MSGPFATRRASFLLGVADAEGLSFLGRGPSTVFGKDYQVELSEAEIRMLIANIGVRLSRAGNTDIHRPGPDDIDQIIERLKQLNGELHGRAG